MEITLLDVVITGKKQIVGHKYYSQADERLEKQWSTEGKEGKAWTEEDVDAWRKKNE